MRTEKILLARDAYWRKVRRFTFALLTMWFVATFTMIFFARELSGFTMFGWPFSFYMAGQGLTLFYLFIVAVYMWRMRRLDKKLMHETSDIA